MPLVSLSFLSPFRTAPLTKLGVLLGIFLIAVQNFSGAEAQTTQLRVVSSNAPHQIVAPLRTRTIIPKNKAKNVSIKIVKSTPGAIITLQSKHKRVVLKRTKRNQIIRTPFNEQFSNEDTRYIISVKFSSKQRSSKKYTLVLSKQSTSVPTSTPAQTLPILLPTSTPTPTATPTPTRTSTATPVPCIEGILLGDINLDRRVDAVDLAFVNNNFGANVRDLPQHNIDLSRDGVVNEADRAEVVGNLGKIGCPIEWTGRFEIYDSVASAPGRPYPLNPRTIAIPGSGYFFTNPNDRSGPADETMVRQYARSLPQNVLMFLNIESWPIDIRIRTTAQVTTTIERYLDVISWVRNERPDLKIGVYSIFPLSDQTVAMDIGLTEYLTSQGDGWGSVAVKDKRVGLNNWQKANDFLRPLAQAVDVVMPSLYLSSSAVGSPFKWFADEHIKEAHRYGKPCIAFIWPRFRINPGPYPLIDGVEMRQQYEAIRDHGAEGMIIWDDSSAPWQAYPWFTQLNQFIATLP